MKSHNDPDQKSSFLVWLTSALSRGARLVASADGSSAMLAGMSMTSPEAPMFVCSSQTTRTAMGGIQFGDDADGQPLPAFTRSVVAAYESKKFGGLGQPPSPPWIETCILPPVHQQWSVGPEGATSPPPKASG